jgi:thiamine pyrophosphate-dependent acetolactate synthase large subunit-like protein
MSAGLVLYIGQYCMPSPGEYAFNPDIHAIRGHPVGSAPQLALDLGVVSDELTFLNALSVSLPRRKRDPWANEIAAARQKFEKTILDQYELGVKYSKDTNHLHPAVIAKEIHDFFYKGNIDPKQTVMGMGGWTIGNFMGRWVRVYRPGQGICCGYQYGAIGPDVAMTISAGAAVQLGIGPQAPYKGAPVCCVSSDAGIAYSLFELDTAQKSKIPVIAVIYNNNSWGMWSQAVGLGAVDPYVLFQENLRYDKMAEGMGARGEYVRTQQELKDALARSYRAVAKESVSTLINCQALKFTSAKDYPPGNFVNPEPGADHSNTSQRRTSRRSAPAGLRGSRRPSRLQPRLVWRRESGVSFDLASQPSIPPHCGHASPRHSMPPLVLPGVPVRSLCTASLRVRAVLTGPGPPGAPPHRQP